MRDYVFVCSRFLSFRSHIPEARSNIKLCFDKYFDEKNILILLWCKNIAIPKY